MEILSAHEDIGNRLFCPPISHEKYNTNHQITQAIFLLHKIEREIINIFKENDIDDFCTVLEKTKQKYKIEEVEILKNIKYKEVVNEDIEKALSLEAVSKYLSISSTP